MLDYVRNCRQARLLFQEGGVGPSSNRDGLTAPLFQPHAKLAPFSVMEFDASARSDLSLDEGDVERSVAALSSRTRRLAFVDAEFTRRSPASLVFRLDSANECLNLRRLVRKFDPSRRQFVPLQRGQLGAMQVLGMNSTLTATASVGLII